MKDESRNNHRYAVVVQDLATQWIQSYPCKTKTSQETHKSLQKFLEPTRKPKVIYTDNSLEFGKSCEKLSWNHCTSTPHRSETNGIAERAAHRVKEGRSAVLLHSGLDEKWWADSMECFCLMGRHPMEGGSEYHLMAPLFLFERWSNNTQFQLKTYRDCINLAQKSCQVYSLDTRYTREESGKETKWSQTLKNWSRWTHLNTTPEGSMLRKC